MGRLGHVVVEQCKLECWSWNCSKRWFPRVTSRPGRVEVIEARAKAREGEGEILDLAMDNTHPLLGWL